MNVLLVCFRVYNYEPLTQLKNVRANCYGKYVALRGTVVRVSNIKPLCTKMAFRCASCGKVQSFPLPDGKYSLPTKVACSLKPALCILLAKKANQFSENVFPRRVYMFLFSIFGCCNTSRCRKYVSACEAPVLGTPDLHCVAQMSV